MRQTTRAKPRPKAQTRYAADVTFLE